MTDGTAWGRHRPLCMYSFCSCCARSEPVVSESCSLKSHKLYIHNGRCRSQAVPVFEEGRGRQGERDSGVEVDACQNKCCIWEGIIGNAWRMLGNIEKV